VSLQEFAGAQVVFGDVTNLQSLRDTAFGQPVDVVVSCLASRTGGKKDSWAIDYQVRLQQQKHGQQQRQQQRSFCEASKLYLQSVLSHSEGRHAGIPQQTPNIVHLLL
jgi:hypothetical protein